MCTNNWHNSSLFLRVWASSTMSTEEVCIPIFLLVVCGLMVLHPPVFFLTLLVPTQDHVIGIITIVIMLQGPEVSSTQQAWCHSHQCHQGLHQGEGIARCGGKCLPWEGERSLCRGFFLPDFCANYAILLFPIVKCPSFYGETLISGIMKSLKSKTYKVNNSQVKSKMETLLFRKFNFSPLPFAWAGQRAR